MTRDDAINELKFAIDLIKQDGKDWLDERDIPLLQMAIEALEQEPRKGEWVDYDWKPAPSGVPVEKCGNCGEWSTQMGKNFCPNCGADMRGKENE